MFKDEVGSKVSQIEASRGGQLMGFKAPLPAPGTPLKVVRSEAYAQNLLKDQKEEQERAQQRFDAMNAKPKRSAAEKAEIVKCYKLLKGHMMAGRGRGNHGKKFQYGLQSRQLRWMWNNLSWLASVPEVREIILDKEAIDQQDTWHWMWSELEKRPGFKNNTFELTTKPDCPVLKLVVKADVQGSVDAILTLLEERCQHPEVKLEVIHSGVGGVNTEDVQLACSTPWEPATIVAFNVGEGKKEGGRRVLIHTFQIVYELQQHVQQLMVDMLPPQSELITHGKGEVQELFKSTMRDPQSGRKVQTTVCGCKVTSGAFYKDVVDSSAQPQTTVHRDGELVWSGGSFLSLKRFKENAAKVTSGKECGVCLRDVHFAPEVGDIITCQEIVPRPRVLEEEFPEMDL
eukprot:TRINITY_DN21744_c0_g1_i2.p1 TRINITY_DN21744_c0_g1~~TRINITY_DN21744_c0_g1_i2.p1  ORF type:complete len:401 (-),score=43.48 TRINITY_DN21744_c0_g1_i2:105-1307(-)